MSAELNPGRLDLQGGYVLHVMSGRPPWYFSIKDGNGENVGHVVFADVPNALRFQQALGLTIPHPPDPTPQP